MNCTCQDPEAYAVRPAAHESTCPTFTARCGTCDGKGYLITKAPKGAQWKALTSDCPDCNATGVSRGSD